MDEHFPMNEDELEAIEKGAMRKSPVIFPTDTLRLCAEIRYLWKIVDDSVETEKDDAAH